MTTEQDLVFIEQTRADGRLSLESKKKASKAAQFAVRRKKSSPSGYHLSLKARLPAIYTSSTAAVASSLREIVSQNKALANSLLQQADLAISGSESNDLVISDQTWKKRNESRDMHLRNILRLLEGSSPRTIMLPSSLRASEEMLQAVFDTTRRGATRRLKPMNLPNTTPGYGTKTLQISLRNSPSDSDTIVKLEISIKTGIEALQSGRSSIANKALDQAFALIKDVLLEDGFYTIESFTRSLLHLQQFNAIEIGQLFLEHIAAMSSIIYDSQHSYSKWARAMLKIFGTKGVLECVLTAWADAIGDTIGSNDPVAYDAKIDAFPSHFLLRSDASAVKDLTTTYKRLISQSPIKPVPRRVIINLDESFAQILIQYEKWAAVESVLSGAPALLEEYQSIASQTQDLQHKFEADSNYHTITSSIGIIIIQMAELGVALSAQGKYEAADKVFQQCISACNRFYGPDDPYTVEVKYYFKRSFQLKNDLLPNSGKIIPAFEEI